MRETYSETKDMVAMTYIGYVDIAKLADGARGYFCSTGITDVQARRAAILTYDYFIALRTL